jgi:hypothetical protein
VELRQLQLYKCLQFTNQQILPSPSPVRYRKLSCPCTPNIESSSTVRSVPLLSVNMCRRLVFRLSRSEMMWVPTTRRVNKSFSALVQLAYTPSNRHTRSTHHPKNVSKKFGASLGPEESTPPSLASPLLTLCLSPDLSGLG